MYAYIKYVASSLRISKTCASFNLQVSFAAHTNPYVISPNSRFYRCNFLTLRSRFFFISLSLLSRALLNFSVYNILMYIL